MLAPVIFFISFVLRLFFVSFPGFKADIAYWKWWGMSAAHDGISGPLVNTAYNYPSFYLYILKFTSHLYEFLTGFNFKLNPNDVVFWSDTNFLYLFLIKLPYILADLGIGILIYKIIKNSKFEAPNSKQISNSNFKNSKRLGHFNLKFWSLFRNSDLGFRISSNIPLLAASLYLFNPVVIYNSSLWGQTDSIGAFLVLLAFYFLLSSKYSLLAVFAAIAVFMKVQTVIFLPLLFLIILLRSNLKETFKSFWVFLATAIIINLPFLITHTMSRVFEVMYSSQAYFPYVSMNAYNLWWLIFGRLSSSFWDQNLIAGLISFKMMGLMLFGAVYAMAIAVILRVTGGELGKSIHYQGADWQDPLVRYVLSAFILVSFSFFLLLTQMHERYLFPLFVFFPILLGLSFSSRRKFLILTTIYLILSTTTLLNLHQVMIMNYPDNVLPLLPNIFSEPLTKIISLVNIVAFIALFFVLTKEISLKVKSFVLGIAVIILIAISVPKLWLYSKPIIYLSELSPMVANQGYGKLETNKSVGGTWLSSLYYFFDKGLGTHANSQIIFDLNKRYASFTTNFGIDTEANESASVVFIIKGDEKTLFVSPKMTRFSFPGFAKVSVSGVKLLELDVTDAGDGINSDHADWLEPKLYK